MSEVYQFFFLQKLYNFQLTFKKYLNIMIVLFIFWNHDMMAKYIYYLVDSFQWISWNKNHYLCVFWKQD